tara:strand:- start:84 stop:485 length:402 start_codon:yes stop_codon:yes gene_type:complete
MTKKITDLFQVEEGAINPKTGLQQKPSWFVRFEDQDDRMLFKAKVLEYLSMGYRKTVENFKAGKATTTQGGEARFWVVVFQDYEVRLQTKAQIMDVVTEGHRHRDESDYAKFEREKEVEIGKDRREQEIIDDE